MRNGILLKELMHINKNDKYTKKEIEIRKEINARDKIK